MFRVLFYLGILTFSDSAEIKFENDDCILIFTVWESIRPAALYNLPPGNACINSPELEEVGLPLPNTKKVSAEIDRIHERLSVVCGDGSAKFSFIYTMRNSPFEMTYWLSSLPVWNTSLELSDDSHLIPDMYHYNLLVLCDRIEARFREVKNILPTSDVLPNQYDLDESRDRFDGRSPTRIFLDNELVTFSGAHVEYGGRRVATVSVPNHSWEVQLFSTELRWQFRRMVEGFFPKMYEDSPEGQAFRQANFLRHRIGYQSDVSLYQVFANLDWFYSAKVFCHRMPEAMHPDPTSLHYLKSIPTLLELDRDYNLREWLSPVWPAKRIFGQSDFYQWAHDIPIIKDLLDRERYIKIRGVFVSNVFIPGELSSEISLYNSKTIGTEFPPPKLTFLNACIRDVIPSTLLGFVGHEAQKLLRFGLIALDTARRSVDKQKRARLTPEMLREFVGYVRSLRPCHTYADTPRIPRIDYSPDLPEALAFNAFAIEQCRTLSGNIPELSELALANFVQFLSEWKTDENIVLTGVLCRLIELANLHAAGCKPYDGFIGNALVAAAIPRLIFRLLSSFPRNICFLILQRVDLAQLVYQAAKQEGFDGKLMNVGGYHDWIPIIEKYEKAQVDWIQFAFEPL